MGQPVAIGRIVHYAQFGRCEASIVTAVNAGDNADLITFPGNGAVVSHVGVDYDADSCDDTWHWYTDDVQEPDADITNDDESDDGDAE